MDSLIAAAREDFANVFGGTATYFGLAPGRVEVIGNHTDYNDGFILAAAIDKRIIIVGRPVKGNKARVHSSSFKSGSSFDVTNPTHSNDVPWINYVAGVVWQLKNIGIDCQGFEALVMGDVPFGAGLSSSAALEVATAQFLKAINGFTLEPIDMAVNCQAAENNFVGVKSGILDQFTSVMGQEGKLVFLDCRNLTDYNYYPLGDDLCLVIANTCAPHSLVDGAYNRLRESCFRAAKVCQEAFPNKKITHLRDVDLVELDAVKDRLDAVDYRRAHHIVTEDERVLDATKALAVGNAQLMGKLMTESHLSSRDWFGNSSPELDIMVDIAISLPGCYGARLSGGGFGGATVNLVKNENAANFAADLNVKYFEKTKIQPEIHLFTAGKGATGGKFIFD